jgi:hypothetical protein
MAALNFKTYSLLLAMLLATAFADSDNASADDNQVTVGDLFH